MLITHEQLEEIINDDLSYLTCDICGYGEVSYVNKICPSCGKDILWLCGEGWDFGYGWREDRRKFGLNYDLEPGDFASGD